MKNKIPEFLQEKLNKTYALADRFPTKVKQFMIDYAEYYHWNTNNYQLIFRLMKDNITFLGNCELEGCNQSKNLTKKGISQGCCKKHSTMITNLKTKGVEWGLQQDSSKEKARQTNIEKYGVDNPMKLKSMVEKGKNTKLSKYGSKNYNNIKQIQKTCVERYGDYNPMRIKKFKDKSRETCIQKYGVNSNLEAQVIKEKIKETNIKLFGCASSFGNKNIQEKSKKSMIANYGVEFPIQNPEIYNKMVKSSYKFKEYKWKTGEISLVQGYELIVLKELEDKGYSFDMILTDSIDMPEIWYNFDNNLHRYYPDFYIPKENLIIEVKSEWTLKLHGDKNQAKFEATKSLGFDFRLEVR